MNYIITLIKTKYLVQEYLYPQSHCIYHCHTAQIAVNNNYKVINNIIIYNICFFIVFVHIYYSNLCISDLSLCDNVKRKSRFFY